MNINYKMIIGIDPDSKNYGVAVYDKCILKQLLNLDLPDFVDFIKQNDALYVIEDIKANKFIYARNSFTNSGIQNKVAQAVGQCKQAQTHCEQFILKYGYPLERVQPDKHNWAKNRAMFQRVTGWRGQSNEDTRSAAYFGYLFLKRRGHWEDEKNNIIGL